MSTAALYMAHKIAPVCRLENKCSNNNSLVEPGPNNALMVNVFLKMKTDSDS